MEIGPIRNQNLIFWPLASMAPKKRTMPLAEKMKFPVGIGSGHFSFFLSADNVYFSLVAGT